MEITKNILLYEDSEDSNENQKNDKNYKNDTIAKIDTDIAKEKLIEDISDFTRDILSRYSSDQIKFIETKMKKNFQTYLDKTVIQADLKNKRINTIRNILVMFCKDYAYLKNEKRFFCRLNGEWESISLDKIYDDWLMRLSFYKSSDQNSEFGVVEIRDIFANRRIIFKNVKTLIYNNDILQLTPGKILFKKTKRAFKYLGLQDDELTYLFAFLGKCCALKDDVENHDFFSNISHVWCGYKIYDVIKSIQTLLNTNAHLRLIKHSIMKDSFKNVCCLNFKYEPYNRKLFLQNVKSLPIQTRMIFTECFRQYAKINENFLYLKIGSLKYYTNRNDLINSYVQKNYQTSLRDILFLDEFFDDFKNWLYHKGIPRSLVTINLFKDYLFTNVENEHDVVNNKITNCLLDAETQNNNTLKNTNSFSFEDSNYIYLNLCDDSEKNEKLENIFEEEEHQQSPLNSAAMAEEQEDTETVHPVPNTKIMHTTERKRTIIFGLVPFMTRQQLFRYFSARHLRADTTAKTTGKTIFSAYLNWVQNRENDAVPGFQNDRIQSFICSRAEMNEFLKIDFLVVEVTTKKVSTYGNLKWEIAVVA
jgi:hypothetical protein